MIPIPMSFLFLFRFSWNIWQGHVMLYCRFFCWSSPVEYSLTTVVDTEPVIAIHCIIRLQKQTLPEHRADPELVGAAVAAHPHETWIESFVVVFFFWIFLVSTTPRQSNIAMENGPGLKMYVLLKMGTFHFYVSLPEGTVMVNWWFGVRGLGF